MKKVVLLAIGVLMFNSMTVKAEEPKHTHYEDVCGYDIVTDTFYPLIEYDTETITMSDPTFREHRDCSVVIYDSQEQIDEEIREGEMEMLAQLVEAEAGTQDYRGKCLVADVVLNRVASNLFPDTVEEVIMQYKTRKSDGEDCYQFSTVKYGTYDEAGWYISDDSFKAAQQEYESEKRIDDNILYFTAGGYNPYCIPAYKYGDHYFGY